MMLKIFFVAITALIASGQNTPSTDTYLLANLMPGVLNAANGYMFDGPDYISNAPTNPTTTSLPTLAQMIYYNYYSASIYCSYELHDLSCLYCQKFKNDVYANKVLNNGNSDTGALVTVSNNRREIVITYRGTINVWNIILDAILINANIPGSSTNIKMHRGYYIATMSLYNEVVENIGFLRYYYPNYKIVITGHSLGAAMARITYCFLKQLNQFPGAVYELYTYGEPRVGNKALADFMNEQTITTARIVARADIFPHTPPTSIATTSILGDFYMHSQTEYWINDNYARFCNQSVYEDPTCSDSLGPGYTVVDHVTYFDANYFTCDANQPAQSLAIPFGILQPVETLPPLPAKLSNFFGDLSNFVLNIISPPLGR